MNAPASFIPLIRRLCVCAVFTLAVSTPAQEKALGPDAASEALVARARTAMSEENYQEARELLLNGLKATPDNPYLIYNIALTHYAEGNHAKARDILMRVEHLARDPELQARVLAQLGNIQVHAGKESVETDSDLAIDYWRQAHQLYQSALRQDSRLDVARRNREPTRDGLVELLLNRAERNSAEARKSRRDSQRIDRLRVAYADVEEAQQLDDSNERARTLYRATQNELVDTLVRQGNDHMKKAAALFKESGVETDSRQRMRKLERSMEESNLAANSFRDALLLNPERKDIELKLEEGNLFISDSRTELGAAKLQQAETEKLLRNRLRLTEGAVEDFQGALLANPDNQRARELLDETLAWLAQHYEESADAAVADAETRSAPAVQESLRTQANDLYEQAIALNPDDSELREKAADNALELAELLQESGMENLEKGRELTPSDPQKAIAALEQAMDDFSTAAQLLEEHGLDAEAVMGGVEDAAAQLADLAGDPAMADPQDGEAPGDPMSAAEAAAAAQAAAEEAAAQAQAAADAMAQQDAAGAQSAADQAQAAAEEAQGAADQASQQEPGTPVAESAQASAEAAAQSAQFAAQQAMLAQLGEASQQAMAAMDSARAGLPPGGDSDTPAAQSGTPSYLSVAYVPEGAGFEYDAEGSGHEVEGSFNTDNMMKPTKDW